MGYTITIGELEVTPYADVGLEEPGVRFDAVGVRFANAPAFGDPTDYTNSRWPSYSTWADFARMVGLYDVLFEGGTLIGGHPGVRLVTPALAAEVSGALERFQVVHPELNPEYNATDEAANLCRLIWLDYWCQWATNNCKVPVIANS